MPRRQLATIQRHEEFQPYASFFDFINDYWRKAMSNPLPPFSDAKNKVFAVINHSRWIVDCPVVGCASANIVSKDAPFWICVECGSPENDETWYNVEFPTDALAIEVVLLHRPFEVNRNWVVTETLSDVRQENRDRGLPDR